GRRTDSESRRRPGRTHRGATGAQRHRRAGRIASPLGNRPETADHRRRGGHRRRRYRRRAHGRDRTGSIAHHRGSAAGVLGGHGPGSASSAGGPPRPRAPTSPRALPTPPPAAAWPAADTVAEPMGGSPPAPPLIAGPV